MENYVVLFGILFVFFIFRISDSMIVYKMMRYVIIVKKEKVKCCIEC